MEDPLSSLEIIKRLGYAYVDYGSHFNYHRLPYKLLEAIAERTRSLRLIPYSLHFPYCLLPPLAATSLAAKRKQFEEVIDIAGFLKVKYLTVHPGVVEGLDADLELLIEYLLQTEPTGLDEINLQTLAICCEYAGQYGITITIENLPFFSGKLGIGRYCNSADDLLRLIGLVKSSGYDNIGACLDTGHANLCRIDIAATVCKLGDDLKQLHINDNRGELKRNNEGDVHLVPGNGDINWPEVYQALEAIAYDGPVMFEFGSRSGEPVERILSEALIVWKSLAEPGRASKRGRQGSSSL